MFVAIGSSSRVLSMQEYFDTLLALHSMIRWSAYGSGLVMSPLCYAVLEH